MKNLLFLLALLLVPAWAEATTYWASTTGSGATCGTTGTSDPGSGYTTLVKGLTCVSAGDTLRLKGGIYSDNNGVMTNSGTDLGAGAITIRNATGETVRFSGNHPIEFYSAATHHVIVDGSDGNSTPCSIGDCTTRIIYDGTLGAGGVVTNLASYIRWKGVEIRNTSENGWQPGTAFPATTAATGMELINSRVHHNGTDLGGTPQHHGIYNNGRDAIIDGNDIYSNCGAGVHAYTATAGYETINQNLIVRNNRVRLNGVCNSSIGILFTAGSNIRVYNNIVHDNNGDGIRPYNTFPPDGAVIYSNTVYQNTGTGLYLFPGPAATGTVWRNNITLNNTPNIDFSAGTVTQSNNLSTGAPTNIFTDPFGSNFTLKTGSAAIDAGFTIGTPYNVSIDGSARPQSLGGIYDIGAYETSTSAPSCPATSPALVASYTFATNGADGTGNGHTAVPGSGWTFAGGGITSNGTSGITVPDHDALDPCGSFTYMVSASLPDTTGPYVLIVKNPDSTAFLFASIDGYCGTGRPMGGYSTTTTAAVACYATSLTTGSFQHLAVTYDSTLMSANVKLYLNGALVASTTGTALLSPTTGTLQFCESGFGEICPSGTVLKNVKIYNYARTAAEIVTDMGMGRTVKIAAGQTLKIGLQ
jgi:hypothetical protein